MRLALETSFLNANRFYKEPLMSFSFSHQNKYMNFSPASPLQQGNPNYCFLYTSPSFQRQHPQGKKFKDGKIKYRIKKRPLCLHGMGWHENHFPTSQEREVAGAPSSALRPAVKRAGGPTWLANRRRHDCGRVQQVVARKGTLLLFPKLVSGIPYLIPKKLLVQCISDVTKKIRFYI